MVKRLPAMWETHVRPLGWEDPLEKEMVTHSRTLAWKIPWTEEPGRLQSMGSLRVRLSNFTFTLPCYLYNKFQPLNENMHSSNPSFRLVSYKLFSNSTSKNPIF